MRRNGSLILANGEFLNHGPTLSVQKQQPHDWPVTAIDVKPR
jgi:hypothetical protein